MDKNIIMAWAQCEIEIGKTGEKDAMATSLVKIGKILERSTSLATDLGTPLEMYASGHKLIAREYPDETLTLTTTVIEQSDELLTTLGIAEAVEESADEEMEVHSHVIQDFFSVKVTPKHAGAKGIKAPKCNIVYTPIFGEETGNQCRLDINITKTTDAEQNYWYRRFTNKTELR